MIVALTVIIQLIIIIGAALIIFDTSTNGEASLKITNFKRLSTIEKKEGFFTEKTDYATVDCTVGFIRKKTTTRKIFKKGMYWKFLDTGKFCPGHKVEELEAADNAQNDLKLANM